MTAASDESTGRTSPGATPPSPGAQEAVREAERLHKLATPGEWESVFTHILDSGTPKRHIASTAHILYPTDSKRTAEERDQNNKAIAALHNIAPTLFAAYHSADATARERAKIEAQKDAAYLERNQIVAALASQFPSGIARTNIPGWLNDWHGCVYIDLPTGQVSWHYHDSQAHLFAHLPSYVKEWDGHTTEEKYARLAALAAQPEEK